MGVIAHARQTLLDAVHYQRLWQTYEAGGRVGRRPPLDPALAELETALTGKQQEEQANAALLHKKGIRFAFSTQGQAGDKPWDKFRDQLGKAIAAGLPPEAALQALTLDAARILGVEQQLGTITAGKAAHLVV